MSDYVPYSKKPGEIFTEDGKIVHEGDTVFNYYDRFWGVISNLDSDGWFDVTSKDGKRAYLNGERISTYDPKGSKPDA